MTGDEIRTLALAHVGLDGQRESIEEAASELAQGDSMLWSMTLRSLTRLYELGVPGERVLLDAAAFGWIRSSALAEA